MLKYYFLVLPTMPIEEPEQIAEGPSRRKFLEWIGLGTVAAAVGGFSGRVEAQVPSRPTYAQLKKALEGRGLHVENGESLAGEGDFKEFRIIDKGDKLFAKMISLEEKGNGYFDLIICEGTHPEDFATRAKRYEKENPGTQVVLQVAGTFTSTDDKPNGSVLHRGAEVGWSTPNARYGGVVTLGPEGEPQVLSKSEFDPNKVGNKDAFQTFTLVEEGVSQHFKDTSLFTRRALIQRDFIDAVGSPQKQWAILETEVPMQLTDFALFLKDCLGVKNAALLDTGAWSTGWLKQADGKTQQLLPDGRREATHFTTLLVGVSKN